MLNNSARNCVFSFSEKRLFLVTLKSKFLKLGPSRLLRAAFPWVPTAGCVKAVRSNHISGVRFSSFPFATRFAYCGTKDRVLRAFDSPTLNGGPDCRHTIP